MKTTLLFLGVAALALCNGCVATYDRTDISTISEIDELPSTVTGRHISITVGGVVTAHVSPFNSDNNPMVGDVVSEDQSVLEVTRAYGANNFAFLGKRAGSTSVELKADGVVVATIDAEVVAQLPQ